MPQPSMDPQFITAELLNPAPNGPLIWRLRFDASILDAYVADVGRCGVAYRLYLNGRFTYSERYQSHEDARQAALRELARRRGDGWLEESR